MSYYEQLCLSFFDMLMLVSILMVMYGLSLKTCIQRASITCILGTFIIGTSGYLVESQGIALTINILLGLLITRCIVNSSIRETVLRYSCALIIIYTVQLCIIVIVELILHDYSYTFENSLRIQCITTIGVWILIGALPMQRITNTILDRSQWYGLLIINIFGVHYSLMIIWYTNLNRFIDSVVGILILVVVILLINTIMLTWGFKNQMLQEKMKMYELYFPMIEFTIEDIRKKQHDYHNHLQTLQTLNNHNLYTSDFVDYLASIKKDEVWSKLIKMDNKILMALLYSKYNEALSLDIQIHYAIHNYLFQSDIPDYDLIEIFGILIDNALQATQNNNADKCHIYIGFESNMNIVETRNKSTYMKSSDIQQLFDKDHTIVQNHGYGLKKLRQYVHKNNGNIVTYYDTVKSELSIRVEIPLSLE